MKPLTHIGTRALLAGGVLSLAVGLLFVRAYEPGITYAHGYTYTHHDLNLTVDSEATYNGLAWPAGTWALKNLMPGVDKFWNFADVKPGDRGENTISLHVDDDAWVCLEFVNLKGQENGVNEPESLVDPTPTGSGELLNEMEFFAWHDDGDNVFEVGEQPLFGATGAQSASALLDNEVYPVADYGHGPAIPKNSTKYVGVQWCAGDLTVNLATAALACNASAMGNEAQTDSMSVDVQLVAAGAKDEPKFKCKDIYVPPHGEQCELGSITTTTSASANTGGNHAGSGGTVVTGDAHATATSNTTSGTSVITVIRNLLRGR